MISRVSLADLVDAEQVEDVIEAVINDDRIAQLRRAFSPTGELASIVAHAESLLPQIASAAERTHLGRVIDRWRRMVEAGEPADPNLDDVAALVADATTWDVRVGAERDAVPTSLELFPADTVDLIMSIARDWSMTSAATPRGKFDVVMPIGGLLGANLSRPAYAAGLITGGVVAAEAVIALASRRMTSAAEQTLARRMGAPADTEQEALEFGMEAAFGFSPHDWTHADATGLMQGPRRHGVALFTGAAPVNAQTGRRATTGEAFAWLLTTPALPNDARVLQITAASCWLAGHVAVLTRAPEGTLVQTVGEPVQNNAGRSQRYLQEMKAFIDSLPALRAWAVARGRPERALSVAAIHES